MTEQQPHASPNFVIDIWKTLREMSEQMGKVVATTQATGATVDGIDERLQNVEKCVATIPALEGRVVSLEGKVAKGNGQSKPAPAVNWPTFVLSLVKWLLAAVVLGAALILGYVELVLPAVSK